MGDGVSYFFLGDQTIELRSTPFDQFSVWLLVLSYINVMSAMFLILFFSFLGQLFLNALSHTENIILIFWGSWLMKDLNFFPFKNCISFFFLFFLFDSFFGILDFFLIYGKS